MQHLIMTGFIDNPYPLMKAADCVVTVADGEPFGRTVVEALALGTPVVAVRGGGPEEIAGGQPGVVLVDPTPLSISDGVLEAFTVGEPDRIGAAARMDQLYSLDTHLQQLYDIIEADAATGTDVSQTDD
jgi:glycosyltransferase involved in cell wall biosynthesis